MTIKKLIEQLTALKDIQGDDTPVWISNNGYYEHIQAVEYKDEEILICR